MENEVAILMADLTGYTAMTEVHGGASASKMIQKYMQLVDGALHGSANVFQRIGDQVVILAHSADDLVITARQLNELTLQENHFLSVHTGLHFGPLYIENNSLFGSTVNVAARIMNTATRSQIVCSKTFVSKLKHPVDIRFIGFQKLKNVRDEIELFEVMMPHSASLSNIDPVCHMHVNRLNTDYTYVYEGINFHFCNQQCMSLFKHSPQSFTQHQV